MLGVSDCPRDHYSGDRMEDMIKEKNIEAGKSGGLSYSPGGSQ